LCLIIKIKLLGPCEILSRSKSAELLFFSYNLQTVDSGGVVTGHPFLKLEADVIFFDLKQARRLDLSMWPRTASYRSTNITSKLVYQIIFSNFWHRMTSEVKSVLARVFFFSIPASYAYMRRSYFSIGTCAFRLKSLLLIVKYMHSGYVQNSKVCLVKY